MLKKKVTVIPRCLILSFKHFLAVIVAVINQYTPRRPKLTVMERQTNNS